MSMEIKEYPVANGVILVMTGDLIFAHRDEFLRAADALRQKGCRHLILDMADVRFVDSSGLGLLALVSQNFKLAQGRVSILRPQGYVREIMALANIPKLIPMFDNEQAALAAY